MKLSLIFLLFIIYSFMGWILEIIYTLFKEKKLVNRGFLIGPYCPIYGIACILFLMLLNKYKNDIIVLFVLSIFICSILEYITSYLLEKKFNARWWNYTDRKFNINGRICLELLIPFGVLGCIFTKWLNPVIISIILKIPENITNIVSIVLAILFIIDVIISYGILSKIKLSTGKVITDNTEEMTAKVREYILEQSKLGKRVLSSFPDLKILKKHIIKEDIKKKKIGNILLGIIAIILIVFMILLANKVYYIKKLDNINYSNDSIKKVIKNNKEKKLINKKYSKMLDIIMSDDNYKDEYFDEYIKIDYVDIDNVTFCINLLLEKKYSVEDINYILKKGNYSSIIKFINLSYQKDVSLFLKYDYSKLEYYERYKNYKLNNESLTYDEAIIYVNIGLDKVSYQDYNTIDNFSYDMLINKYNKLSDNFTANDLVKIDNNYTNNIELYGNKTMINKFIEMSLKCKEETGSKLLIRSAYRSYDDQKNIYDYNLNLNGEGYAEEYVAHPLFSEHQTGLAIDIKDEYNNVLDDTLSNSWLINNAYKYGFILRYPNDKKLITGFNYESWHYRYVGEELAKIIHDENITLEEYYAKYK